jgi:predicted nucleic-acid-binding protein
MIGLDTNILLRLVLQDDPRQSKQVLDLFSRLGEVGPGYVSCICLMEFAWFLRNRIRLGRRQVMDAISDLLDSEDIQLEDENMVEEALSAMAEAPVEFADVFIAFRNRRSGCRATLTFDQKAAKSIPGMELLQ